MIYSELTQKEKVIVDDGKKEKALDYMREIQWD